MEKAIRRTDVLNENASTLIRVKARQLVRRPGFSRSDREDVEHDLVVYLLTKAEHFDPDRASINTFVARIINSAVAMLVRESKRTKRNGGDGVEIQSLETKVKQDDGPPAPLWATITSADLDRRKGGSPLSDVELFELVEGVTSAVHSLPVELQVVCRSLLERNHAETKRELGMSRRSFDNSMESIREHFTKAGLAKS